MAVKKVKKAPKKVKKQDAPDSEDSPEPSTDLSIITSSEDGVSTAGSNGDTENRSSADESVIHELAESLEPVGDGGNEEDIEVQETAVDGAEDDTEPGDDEDTDIEKDETEKVNVDDEEEALPKDSVVGTDDFEEDDGEEKEEIDDERSGAQLNEMDVPEININKLYGPPRKKTRKEKTRTYFTTVVIAILVGLSIFAFIRFTAPGSGFDSDDDGMPDEWERKYGLNPNDDGDRKLDPDGDGLSNLAEYRYGIPDSHNGVWNGGTHPNNADSDGDIIQDGWEIDFDLDPLNATDAKLDPDGDGLDFTVNNVTLKLDFSNYNEYRAGTDPYDPDTDNDGMLDGWEDYFKLDPLNSSDSSIDPDGDGLENAVEYLNGTNPTKNDTDSDGLDDLVELVTHGTNPLFWDTDEDGIPDGWEVEFGLDPLNGKDAYHEEDDDDLPNWREYYHGTDPYDPDTDGDNMPDGWEVEMGRNRNGTIKIVPTFPDQNSDPDGDDLPNLQEYLKGTDPLEPDTDDDGLSDGMEAGIGFPGRLVDGVFMVNDSSFRYHTDPLTNDTDHDQILDADEINNGTNASDPDTDDDGLGDLEERETYLTNPSLSDTDSDGLSDWQEVKGSTGYITNPHLRDTDNDGLIDGDEVLTDYLPYRKPGPLPGHATDPTDQDSDGDGIPDGWEADLGLTRDMHLIREYTMEVGISLWFDKDHAFLEYNRNASGWEEFLDADGNDKVDADLPGVLIINPLLAEDRLLDPDNDGLSNLDEHRKYREITGRENSTNPLSVDTDGDGMTDSWELEYLTYFSKTEIWSPDPLSRDSHDDPDDDGCHYEIDGNTYYHPFVNIEEFWWSNFYPNHCNPSRSDNDGDDIPDGKEIWKHSYDGNINSGDGLPNGWECVFGAFPRYVYGPEDFTPSFIMPLDFNPFENDSNNDGIMDRDADPDNDGHTNLEEFLRNTDPTNPLSVPSRTRGAVNDMKVKSSRTVDLHGLMDQKVSYSFEIIFFLAAIGLLCANCVECVFRKRMG